MAGTHQAPLRFHVPDANHLQFFFLFFFLVFSFFLSHTFFGFCCFACFLKSWTGSLLASHDV